MHHHYILYNLCWRIYANLLNNEIHIALGYRMAVIKMPKIDLQIDEAITVFDSLIDTAEND